MGDERWFIDLEWLEQHGRSFSVLATGCLCPACREHLEEEKKPISDAELLAHIRDCCSQTPEFITEKSPVSESVFRLLLANGNQPLGLAELNAKLAEWRGGSPQRLKAEFLSRLLESDQYYGLRPVAQSGGLAR
jgi:hypothetical protein